MTEEAFAARLRRAMDDAGIQSAAELERRWVAAFGGTPANVHRQVMRLLNHTETPRPQTAQRLGELTGKPADYFIDGQPERRQSRLARLELRLEEVSALAVDDAAALQEIRLAIEEHDNLLRSVLRSLEDLRGSYETRLTRLESELPRRVQR